MQSTQLWIVEKAFDPEPVGFSEEEGEDGVQNEVVPANNDSHGGQPKNINVFTIASDGSIIPELGAAWHERWGWKTPRRERG